MSTFGAMKTRIADDMVRDDLASQVANAINDAIELQEGERYNFNERQYRIDTVANTDSYSLQSPTLITSGGAAVSTGETILEIDSVVYRYNNGQRYRLTERSKGWFEEVQTEETSTGRPTDYVLFNRFIVLWPKPDTTGDQLRLFGLARLGPNPLSADDDTNAWMTDGAGIIRGQAKLLLYRDILRDPEGVQIARAQIVEAGGNPDPASAKRKMAAQAYTGRVRPWSL